MALTALRPFPKFSAFDALGNVLAGGKLYTYSAGTSSPLPTYTDSTGVIANTNPVILDSNGQADIWFQPLNYKLVLKDADDNLIWSVDNYSGSPYPITDEWLTYIHTWTYLSATQVSVPGDQTAIYQVNKAIRAVCTGGTFYGTITAAIYDGSTKTTLTVLFDVGSFDSGVAGSSKVSIGVQSNQSPALIAAGNAATSAGQAAADAAQTAADRVQTGQDRVATAADRVQTGLDKAATAADRVQTGLDKAATAADRVQTGADKAATAADRVQTGQDKAATAADRVQTGQDRAATAADRVQTGLDKAATELLLDSFDDRYLGAKAANPTKDNDGDALLIGALYWNTTAGEMRVWSGSAWAAAYLPASGYATASDLATKLDKAGDTLTGALNNAATVSLASAATVNIGAAASNDITITGTTTITSFGIIAAGATRKVKFAGALTLTHNAASLILPGNANVATAANDTAQFTSLGGGNWICDWYKKADGKAVVAPTVAAGLTCLATASASNVAAVDFTQYIDGTYDEYVVEIDNVVPVTHGAQLLIRTSSDGGASFAAGATDYYFSSSKITSNTTTISGDTSAAGAAFIRLCGDSGPNAYFYEGGISGEVRFYSPLEANYKRFNWHIGFGGAPVYSVMGSGIRYGSTAAINALRFLFNSGNIASGKFKLYGVRKAP